MKSLSLFIFAIVVAALFIFGIYWLWQRQPKNTNEREASTQTVESTNPTPNANSQDLKPANFSILKDTKIKIEGKTNAKNYVVIATNTNQTVAKADQNGKFVSDFTLTAGLNIINLTFIPEDGKNSSTSTLNLYSSSKESAKNFLNGSVKSIFDNLVTVSTSDGDKTTSVTKTAQIDVPKDKDVESTATALSQIRVGDYIVLIGNLKPDSSLDASKATVLRENKPQNATSVFMGTILVAPKQNITSAKSVDGDLQELTINKNTDFLRVTGDGKLSDIVKDKKTIVVYHKEDTDKIANLFFLLP